MAVRHIEGLMHGFLSLSAMDGAPLAQGYLVQLSANDRLTNYLVFPFKDGSLHDETAVYSQRGNFRLFTYHLIQKGPTFGPSHRHLLRHHLQQRDGPLLGTRRQREGHHRSHGIAAGHRQRPDPDIA